MMIDWQSIAPWGIALTALVLSGAQAFLSRRRLQQIEKKFRERSETMVRELHATSSGSMGVGQRVVGCERELHELRGMVDEMRQNDPLRVSYDEASRLVDLGADIHDLMDTCGISRPEAELVSALRRKQAA